ncbi:hypothetical protein HELRODRAFT_173191 [Helobdella robusta]|uniref:HAT C-terminal dimerisation domain-containing protein n=1 Tax=Helobdella robusta TaxID=6412 RepID=T1F6J0_HELRO|nr:hypothetical protein HELRODRAFT_173191 [Helobdella robusta]ESO04104.1 hypothetical protein HELRODRAFT_173191 [Helobdella robusta]
MLKRAGKYGYRDLSYFFLLLGRTSFQKRLDPQIKMLVSCKSGKSKLQITPLQQEGIIRGELEKYCIELSSVFYATTDTTNTMPCTARQLGISWQGCAAHNTLRAILPILRPTAEATTVLSADSNVSISLIYPCIFTLKEELVSKSSTSYQQFRDELLKQYWQTLKEAKLAKILMNCHVSLVQDRNRGSLMDSMFNKVHNAQGDIRINKISTISEQIKNEVSLYLKQAVVDRNSDPLQFWKESINIFPLLARAARNSRNKLFFRKS